MKNEIGHFIWLKSRKNQQGLPLYSLVAPLLYLLFAPCLLDFERKVYSKRSLLGDRQTPQLLDVHTFVAKPDLRQQASAIWSAQACKPFIRKRFGSVFHKSCAVMGSSFCAVAVHKYSFSLIYINLCLLFKRKGTKLLLTNIR